jgi:hypothetical protein
MFSRPSLIIASFIVSIWLVGVVLNRRSVPPVPIVHAQQTPIEPGSIDDEVQKAVANGVLSNGSP